MSRPAINKAPAMPASVPPINRDRSQEGNSNLSARQERASSRLKTHRVTSLPIRSRAKAHRTVNKVSKAPTRDNNTREDGSPQNTDTKGQGGQSKDDPTRSPDQKSQQSSEQRPDAKGGDGQQEKGGGGVERGQEVGRQFRLTEVRRNRISRGISRNSRRRELRGEARRRRAVAFNQQTRVGLERRIGWRSLRWRRKGGRTEGESIGHRRAGRNTAADEGAGQSDEAGDGDAGDRSGGDRQSQNQTGQQGKQPGQGSETKSGQGQEQAGGDRAPTRAHGRAFK